MVWQSPFGAAVFVATAIVPDAPAIVRPIRQRSCDAVRPSDVRTLIRFNTRMGMYIYPTMQSNVVAYIHGYEHGTGGECPFTKLLSAHIAKRIHATFRAARGPRRPVNWIERAGG